MLEPRDFTHDPEYRWPIQSLGGSEKTLDESRLCFVYATGYMPTIEAGSLTIKPRANTNSPLFANDLHFTLNHLVAGHMQGNWDAQPYIALRTFSGAEKSNGVPESIHTVDTWWYCHAGQNIHLPNALLVRPGYPSI